MYSLYEGFLLHGFLNLNKLQMNADEGRLNDNFDNTIEVAFRFSTMGGLF